MLSIFLSWIIAFSSKTQQELNIQWWKKTAGCSRTSWPMVCIKSSSNDKLNAIVVGNEPRRSYERRTFCCQSKLECVRSIPWHWAKSFRSHRNGGQFVRLHVTTHNILFGFVLLLPLFACSCSVRGLSLVCLMCFSSLLAPAIGCSLRRFRQRKENGERREMLWPMLSNSKTSALTDKLLGFGWIQGLHFVRIERERRSMWNEWTGFVLLESQDDEMPFFDKINFFRLLQTINRTIVPTILWNCTKCGS